jgi:O-antigen ligase
MAFNQLLKHPILGLGLGGTTAYNTTLGLSITNIHNVVLQFLCDQGFIAFLIFIYIIISIIKRTRKEDKFLILILMLSLYFPICFQNGLVGYTFWWPLTVLEVVSRWSQRRAFYGRQLPKNISTNERL